VFDLICDCVVGAPRTRPSSDPRSGEREFELVYEDNNEEWGGGDVRLGSLSLRNAKKKNWNWRTQTNMAIESLT
jgi:hypothetical protein